MAAVGQPTVERSEGEGTGPGTGGWWAGVGLALLPLVGLLIVLELVGGLRGTAHYLTVSGITARRRGWSTAYCLAAGAVGPVAVALMLGDVLRTGMTWRSRLALVGFLGAALGAMAVLLLLPYSV